MRREHCGWESDFWFEVMLKSQKVILINSASIMEDECCLLHLYEN